MAGNCAWHVWAFAHRNKRPRGVSISLVKSTVPVLPFVYIYLCTLPPPFGSSMVEHLVSSHVAVSLCNRTWVLTTNVILLPTLLLRGGKLASSRVALGEATNIQERFFSSNWLVDQSICRLFTGYQPYNLIKQDVVGRDGDVWGEFGSRCRSCGR